MGKNQKINTIMKLKVTEMIVCFFSTKIEWNIHFEALTIMMNIQEMYGNNKASFWDQNRTHFVNFWLIKIENVRIHVLMNFSCSIRIKHDVWIFWGVVLSRILK